MDWGGNILFSSLLVGLKSGTGTFLQKNISVACCISLKSLSVKSKTRLYEASKIMQVENELLQKSYFKLCFSRNIYNAAAWYHNHCLGQMPVVMVTEDEDAIRQYGNETEGVFVISFKVTCQKNKRFPLCCIKMMKQVHLSILQSEFTFKKTVMVTHVSIYQSKQICHLCECQKN